MQDVKTQDDRSVIFALQTLVGELQDDNEKLKKENNKFRRCIAKVKLQKNKELDQIQKRINLIFDSVAINQVFEIEEDEEED